MHRCVVCGGHAEDDEVVKCSVCGAVMHKRCLSDEALLDADGNPLCPYDAMAAALDWFDTTLSIYASSLSEEQKSTIISRLRSYLSMLEKPEDTTH